MISPSALRRRLTVPPATKRSFIFRKSRFARGIHYVGGVQEERERDTTKANHYSFHWSRPTGCHILSSTSLLSSIPPSQIIFCTQTRMHVLIQEVSSKNILHYLGEEFTELIPMPLKEMVCNVKNARQIRPQPSMPSSGIASCRCCVVLSKNFNYMSLSRRCHRTRRVCNFFAHYQSYQYVLEVW